jgi:hypothetical protein
MSEMGSVPPTRLALTVGFELSSDCSPRPKPLDGAVITKPA